MLPAVRRVSLVAALVAFLGSPAFADTIFLTGFESGTTAGFTLAGEGNAQVLNSLGSYSPFAGSFFALLSNGPGDQGGANDRVELLSNPFSLTALDTLTIAVLALTAEFSGVLADPARLDSFGVSLLPVGGGAPIDLLQTDVAAPAFTPIASGPVSAPAGDTFFDATDWMMLTATGLAGSYQLLFTIADAGDNSFDSGLLIDAPLPAGPTPVPEPSLMLLLATGAAMAARRRMPQRQSGDTARKGERS